MPEVRWHVYIFMSKKASGFSGGEQVGGSKLRVGFAGVSES